METFRPDVDAIVIRLLGSKPRITDRDFMRNADDFSLRLRPHLARRLIELIGAEMDTTVLRPYVSKFAKSL